MPNVNVQWMRPRAVTGLLTVLSCGTGCPVGTHVLGQELTDERATMDASSGTVVPEDSSLSGTAQAEDAGNTGTGETSTIDPTDASVGTGPGSDSTSMDDADSAASTSGSDDDGERRVVDVAVGDHVCARLSDGAVRCWGSRSSYLGYPHIADDLVGSVGERAGDLGDLELGFAASQLALHPKGVCALSRAGEALCWGYVAVPGFPDESFGDKPIIGDDESPGAYGTIAFAQPATAIAGGQEHACVLLEGGTLQCWGHYWYGGLGNVAKFVIGDDEHPSAAPALRFSAAGPNPKVSAIEIDDKLSCARFESGAVRCWGEPLAALGVPGYAGHPGDAINIPDIEFGGGVVDLALRKEGGCAVMDGPDGRVRCWGLGAESGRLGVPSHVETIGDDEHPREVPPIELGGPATSVCMGRDHACALMADGTVRCWGERALGVPFAHQMGLGRDVHPTAVDPVTLPAKVERLDCGRSTTCAVTVEGELYCWGDVGEDLGHGTSQSIGHETWPASHGPVPVLD